MARNRTALAKWLETQGITQLELAERLRESTVNVSSWVRGVAEPSNFAKLRKIHRITGISYAELVGDKTGTRPRRAATISAVVEEITQGKMP